MILIYSGKVGVYLDSHEDLVRAKKGVEDKHKADMKRKWFARTTTVSFSNLSDKMVAVKGPKDIIGAKGLNKRDIRGASWVALTTVKAFLLPVTSEGDHSKNDNFVDIMEKFHRSQVFDNITFQLNLDYGTKVNFIKIEKLSGSFNTLFLKKGDVVVKNGSKMDQLYIVKKGTLRVEKRIKTKHINSWPVGSKKWKSVQRKNWFVRELDPVQEKYFFGLHELISNPEQPRNLTISVASETAILLNISRKKLLEIMKPKDVEIEEGNNDNALEILKTRGNRFFLESEFWVKFKSDQEILHEIMKDLHENREKKKIVKLFRREALSRKEGKRPVGLGYKCLTNNFQL
jgi:hypothetical protein